MPEPDPNPDAQTYSRRNLMLYLAIMEGSPPDIAAQAVDALAQNPDLTERLREEISWAQFMEEAPQLKELLS